MNTAYEESHSSRALMDGRESMSKKAYYQHETNEGCCYWLLKNVLLCDPKNTTDQASGKVGEQLG